MRLTSIWVSYSVHVQTFSEDVYDQVACAVPGVQMSASSAHVSCSQTPPATAGSLCQAIWQIHLAKQHGRFTAPSNMSLSYPTRNTRVPLMPLGALLVCTNVVSSCVAELRH